jgi:hypothetical protein
MSFGRGSARATVGTPVQVNMAGFRRYGISIGDRVPPVDGRVVAVGLKGVTVKLDTVLEGLDTVTIESRRLAVV